MLARSVAIAHPLGSSPARRTGVARTINIFIICVGVGLGPAAARSAIRHYRAQSYKPGPGTPATAYYYAGEYTRGYQQWSRDNADHACPNQLADLNPYTNRRDNDTADPWGNPMRMTCAGDAIEVRSAGPDGAFNTKDDIQLRSA